MKKDEELEILIDIAEKLGFKVYIDRILTTGGSCRIYDKKYIVINKNLSLSFKKRLLKDILKKKIDNNIYLEPRLKKILGVE
uniref:Uncharacterized protein n=1 Tax=candidate division WOR-3 bacterium TaxID=2052148 RepID=A0A7C4U5Y2_UNCW3